MIYSRATEHYPHHRKFWRALFQMSRVSVYILYFSVVPRDKGSFTCSEGKLLDITLHTGTCSGIELQVDSPAGCGFDGEALHSVAQLGCSPFPSVTGKCLEGARGTWRSIGCTPTHLTWKPFNSKTGWNRKLN